MPSGQTYERKSIWKIKSVENWDAYADLVNRKLQQLDLENDTISVDQHTSNIRNIIMSSALEEVGKKIFKHKKSFRNIIAIDKATKHYKKLKHTYQLLWNILDSPQKLQKLNQLF